MVMTDYESEGIPELLGYPGLMARWMSSEMDVTEREQGWRILKYLARNYLMENNAIGTPNSIVHWNSLHTDIFGLDLEEVLIVEHPTDNEGNVIEDTVYISFNHEALTSDQQLLWTNGGYSLELIWFIANHSRHSEVRSSFNILLDYFRVEEHKIWKHVHALNGGNTQNSVMVSPNGRLNTISTMYLAELLTGD